jgi:hypothetical protein
MIWKNLPQLAHTPNPGRQVFWAMKFSAVAPKLRAASVWNLLHITFLVPRILKWLVGFTKMCGPGAIAYHPTL